MIFSKDKRRTFQYLSWQGASAEAPARHAPYLKEKYVRLFDSNVKISDNVHANLDSTF